MPKQFVLGRGWLPLSWRFRIFFSHHRRFFTLVGAFIVFLTFVVKEGMRESQKELVESVRAAENDFRSDVKNAENSIRLDRIEKELSLLEFKQNQNQSQNKIDVLRRESETAEKLNSIAMSMQNTIKLWKKVGNPDKNELSKIAEMRHNVAIAARNYQLVFETDLALARYDDPEEQKSGNDKDDLFEKLQKSIEPVLKQSNDMSNLVFKDVEEIRERDEKRLRRVTLASYVLFGLGWTIAFIGKLYGVNVGESE